MCALLRYVPPVRSPITLQSIVAGLTAATSRREADRAKVLIQKLISSRFGTSTVLLTDSGTSALSLALRYSASGSGRRRPVALPAYGCYDLATAIDAADAPFVLYDLDATTLGPNWDSLREALEAGADRIVVVHQFGIPVDLDRARVLCEEYDALLIEDAAQGAGASWRGTPLGASGSLGVLSFGRGKGMTGGRGGALLANDMVGRQLMEAKPALPAPNASVMEVITFLGQWMLARPLVYGIPAAIPFFKLGETQYHRPSPERRASHFCLGALSRTAALVDAETSYRRANAARLAASLDAERLRAVSVAFPEEAGFLRLPIYASAELSIAARLSPARRLGIMPGYPLSLASLDGFGTRRLNSGHAFANSAALSERLITLPTHGALSEFDLRALEQWCHSGD